MAKILAFDLFSVADEHGTIATPGGNVHNDSGWDVAAYANVQATDKLSFNGRFEYYDLQSGVNPYVFSNGKGEEFTLTLQYNLWANVISRAEFRWDHADQGTAFGGDGGLASSGFGGTTAVANSYELALNLIYTF
jgi:hypothetical protein